MHADVTVDIAVGALQGAVQKLKAGLDELELDLQKIREWTIADLSHGRFSRTILPIFLQRLIFPER